MPHLVFDLNVSPPDDPRARFGAAVARRFGEIMETGTDRAAVLVRGHSRGSLTLGLANDPARGVALANADLRRRTKDEERRLSLAFMEELERRCGGATPAENSRAPPSFPTHQRERTGRRPDGSLGETTAGGADGMSGLRLGTSVALARLRVCFCADSRRHPARRGPPCGPPGRRAAAHPLPPHEASMSSPPVLSRRPLQLRHARFVRHLHSPEADRPPFAFASDEALREARNLGPEVAAEAVTSVLDAYRPGGDVALASRAADVIPALQLTAAIPALLSCIARLPEDDRVAMACTATLDLTG